MNYKNIVKVLILFSLMITSSNLVAQTQQGMVKTRGKLDSNGKVIKGYGVADALVRTGSGNTMRSRTDGCFSFAVKEWYTIEMVTKKGFALSDPDILGRKQLYQNNIPLYIVVESEEEQARERINMERRIRRTLGRQLALRERELDSLRELNTLTIAEYTKRAQELYDAQSKQENLIRDMVGRYLKTDYDMLDSLNRAISSYILQGELVKADSLIRTKGDLKTRIAKYEEHKNINIEEENKLKERQKQLEKSKQLAEEELARLAYDCYEKHEYFKLQHKHDSAAYYLDMRAQLDTTNLKWQFEVGEYVTGYLTDFRRAQHYFERALSVALLQGDETKDVATCYNNLGYINVINVKLPEAFSLLSKAVELRIKLLGENHPDLATTYNFLAYANTIKHDYEVAADYFKKANLILQSHIEDSGDDMVFNLLTTGLCYRYMGKYQEALEVCNKGLTLAEKLYKGAHPYKGSANHYIASIYKNMEEYDKALDYYDKAIENFKTDYGYDSPYLSSIYNDLATISMKIGEALSDRKQLEDALQYYEKGISIDKKYYGEIHPNIAAAYSHMSSVYSLMGRFEKAFDFIEKSLTLLQKIYRGKHPNIATVIYNKGELYSKQKNYKEAVRYKEEGLNMYKELVPATHPSIKVMESDLENNKKLLRGQTK